MMSLSVAPLAQTKQPARLRPSANIRCWAFCRPSGLFFQSSSTTTGRSSPLRGRAAGFALVDIPGVPEPHRHLLGHPGTAAISPARGWPGGSFVLQHLRNAIAPPWFPVPEIDSADFRRARQVANVHTIFNVINTIIFLPLISFLFCFSIKSFPTGLHQEESNSTKTCWAPHLAIGGHQRKWS